VKGALTAAKEISEEAFESVEESVTSGVEGAEKIVEQFKK
jgi:hypothetical protein